MRFNAVEPGFTKTNLNGNTGLQTAEGMSSDWIRHQTLVRAVVRELLAAERRRSTPLRHLAHRVGVNR